jgi:Cdc6-like AAA superfamily ATPase
MRADPEVGFTSDVIRDPGRFVGRTDLIEDCIKALNTPLGLIAVYGKRGVGKSSLMRQLQQMALADYTLARRASLAHAIPKRPRGYLTVYYSCDAMIKDGQELLRRLCNDQHDEDGLLRLVPNDGKDLAEFTRTREIAAGADLKIVNWGTKGIESSKYARVVEGDVVQTFRNFVSAVVTHQVKKRMKRDALLILLDEFDVIKDKAGLGSLIKSLTSADVKFAISGIGDDMSDLVQDHASVERLLEEGAVHVQPMHPEESKQIIYTAQTLFQGAILFDPVVVEKIAEISRGYPYFTQLLGKGCVAQANKLATKDVAVSVFDLVLDDVRHGRAFPTLENAYQRAIGNSKDRQLLLHLLAEQKEDHTLYDENVGRIVLKEARKDAEQLDVQYVDQLIPRLVDEKYGPCLKRVAERQGIYEFVNPVLRLYVNLRQL